jgi:hypothetical protein
VLVAPFRGGHPPCPTRIEEEGSGVGVHLAHQKEVRVVNLCQLLGWDVRLDGSVFPRLAAVLEWRQLVFILVVGALLEQHHRFYHLLCMTHTQHVCGNGHSHRLTHSHTHTLTHTLTHSLTCGIALEANMALHMTTCGVVLYGGVSSVFE